MALIFKQPSNSIWNTLEFDCISRDFDYEGYEARAKLSDHTGALMSREAYNVLAKVFFDEMTRSYDEMQREPVHSVMDNTQVS